MFSWLLFTPAVFKNFSLLTKLKDFDFVNPIPGGGVIFTSPISLPKKCPNAGKYGPEITLYLETLYAVSISGNSAQNWHEGKS